MDRQRLLLSGLIATAFACALVAAPLPAAACTLKEMQAGGCSVDSGGSTGDEHVDIWAEMMDSDQPVPSTGDAQEEAVSEQEGSDEWAADESAATPSRPENCSPVNVALCAVPPALPADPAAPVPGVVVTLRDIASFVPAGPGSEMEPGGWAVEDLPANFVAVASVQVVSGMLLGQPADVRFTPVGFRWLHSDGAVVESGSPGATWAVLGQREFSVTGTSHVYAESGEYTVALEVVLRAEYRFAGSGWQSIVGTLAVAGDPQRVLVGEFDTVLTNGDCNTNPSGPGC
ncbi:hypothetical protein [Agromyces laixinhei]|uniref:hypothetical protein n=1 Tax=Agromyces laixinhei TaxID=2585717 RepID=UPI0012EED4E3|nr:hypothetical protein [Agromyces laixinhei]